MSPGSPAIVVVGYDRPHSLERLLRSLASAVYPPGPVPLVISIDGAHPGSLEVAHGFTFPHGPKAVLARERLGLVDHVLACGDLVEEHGRLVMLEDDLVASPHFFRWATAALDFYADDDRVGGISLYRYAVTESCPAPFEPLDDGSDVHFVQIAASWGQAWTREQWRRFRTWDAAHGPEQVRALLPGYMRRWHGPSWKRRFVAHLVATGRSFVFPPVALTTNYHEAGTSATTFGLYQVTLEARARDYRFVRAAESRAVYDAWFEMTPECLDTWTDAFRGHRYDVDLYGVKDPGELAADHVLTTRACREPLREYGLKRVPNLANVIEGVEGRGIAFAPRERVEDEPAPPARHHYRFASVAEEVWGGAKAPGAAGLDLSIVTVERAAGEAAALAQALRAGATALPGRLRHRIVAATHGEDADVAALDALARAPGAIHGVLPPGTTLVPGALSEIVGIFSALPAVGWLATLPGRADPAGNVSPVERPAEWIRRARHSPPDLPWAGVFWRQQLWDHSIGDGRPPVSARELWSRLAEVAPLHVALDAVTCAAAASAVVSPAPRRVRRGRARGWLAAATWPLFELGPESLRVLHWAPLLAPHVVVWNSRTGGCLLWHYPPEATPRG